VLTVNKRQQLADLATVNTAISGSLKYPGPATDEKLSASSPKNVIIDSKLSQLSSMSA